MNKIIVQGYTVRETLGDEGQVADTFKKIAAIGYQGIQMALPNTMSAEKLKSLLDAYGLIRPTVSSATDAILADPAAAIEDARLFDAPVVTVPTVPQQWRAAPDGFKRYADAMNRAGALLKKEGLRLGYHNHALEFISFGGTTGMDILFSETDADNVEFVLDTHWLAAGGVNPPDWIRRAKGRMTLVHFKDYAIGPGAESIGTTIKQFAEVGQGNLDWYQIIKACRETGVCWFAVEQDTCPVDPFTSLKISYDYLKRMGV
ncbi:MAG: sugar phosphate isomerase/epimerase [Oscillospiraceae bacterium]|jgi:sugar phosphate isomerase/epimerase|nr:sugar phosphate isomerase/epimerase [Oscillospiraceae bacterium]